MKIPKSKCNTISYCADRISIAPAEGNSFSEIWISEGRLKGVLEYLKEKQFFASGIESPFGSESSPLKEVFIISVSSDRGISTYKKAIEEYLDREGVYYVEESDGDLVLLYESIAK